MVEALCQVQNRRNICLLIFDGASSHLDPDIVQEADAHDIKLFCLPSNTTHELQPMDRSVFRAFEQYWDQEVMDFLKNHTGERISKERFGKLFSPVWQKSLTPKNVISGFRVTGIFPFNSNVIPERAFAPSDVSYRPSDSVSQLPHESEQETNVAPSTLLSVSDLQEPDPSTVPSTSSVDDLQESDPTRPIGSPVRSPNVSFHCIMNTPKLVRKSDSGKRKRSLTYKAQLLTKELFTTKKRFKQTPVLSKKQKSRALSCDRPRKDEKLKMNHGTAKSARRMSS